jgi:pectin methylesterase-like acyl-CoA thioesterase
MRSRSVASWLSTVAVCAAATLAQGVLGSRVAHASPSTLTVQIDTVGADYDEIQDAIDAASSGDTIEVYPGTYNEQLTIDKQVHIVGVDRDACIVSCSTTGYVVEFQSGSEARPWQT